MDGWQFWVILRPMIRAMKIESPSRGREPWPDANTGVLEADVARVVAQLQRAMSELVFALARPIRGGTGIQQELGLPSTLSWQIHAFITARDPLSAIDQIPGRQASKRTLEAAASKGVPREVVERASSAFEEFDACVRRHTGSRAAFASMVSGLSATESTSVELKARRDLFRAASRIYGVQLETLVNCYILHPGATPDRFDYVFITTSIGVQVTRSFEKLFVGRHRSVPDRPIPGLAPSRPVEASEEADGGGGWCIPLVKDFSTLPRSSFSTEPGAGGLQELYVSGQPVGRTGAFTYVLAQHWPGAVPRDEVMSFDTTHMYAAEHVVHDLLLWPGVARREPAPKTGVYGGALHEIRCRYRDVDRLNVPAQTTFVGEGPEALRTPRFPRYLELLRYVCVQMGWDIEGFDAYRCEVEYPVLHSLLNTTFPAREGAGA